MPRISGSVGAGGANKRGDVVIVQQLLNNHLQKIGPLAKLPVDGIVGPRTLAAIEAFQRKVLGLHHPDRRVDVHGRTLAALEKPAPAAPTAQRSEPAPARRQVTIYLGVDPRLTENQKKQLREAGEYVRLELQGAYQDFADVQVTDVEDLNRLKAIKGGRATKIVYGLAQQGPEGFQQVFKDHGEKISDGAAFELAKPGTTEGHAAGIAAGDHGDSVVAAVNVSKIRENFNLLRNRLLHEVSHLLGHGHASHVMKPSIGDTEGLLPLPPRAPAVLKGVQSRQ